MIPSKMFYYMAAGASVVGICRGRSDMSEIIQNSGCGVISEPKNPIKLAEVIRDLAHNIGVLNRFKGCARTSAKESYSREVCTKSLAASLLPLLNQ